MTESIPGPGAGITILTMDGPLRVGLNRFGEQPRAHDLNDARRALSVIRTNVEAGYAAGTEAEVEAEATRRQTDILSAVRELAQFIEQCDFRDRRTPGTTEVPTSDLAALGKAWDCHVSREDGGFTEDFSRPLCSILGCLGTLRENYASTLRGLADSVPPGTVFRMTETEHAAIREAVAAAERAAGRSSP